MKARWPSGSVLFGGRVRPRLPDHRDALTGDLVLERVKPVNALDNLMLRTTPRSQKAGLRKRARK
jgi:hypothetical protein